MKKKNKNKKLNGLIIKSFIILAVIMMLLSVMLSEGAELNTLVSGVGSQANDNFG